MRHRLTLPLTVLPTVVVAVTVLAALGAVAGSEAIAVYGTALGYSVGRHRAGRDDRQDTS